MAGINSVTILGFLGTEPDSKVLPNGDSVTTISVATSRKWQSATTKETKELVEWHRIILYRNLAEVAREYLHKGSQVYIQGYLRTRKWEDKDKIERYTTEIIAEKIELLGKQNSEQIKQNEVEKTSTQEE